LDIKIATAQLLLSRSFFSLGVMRFHYICPPGLNWEERPKTDLWRKNKYSAHQSWILQMVDNPTLPFVSE